MGTGTPLWVNQVLSHSMDSAPETTQHLQAWRSGNRDVAAEMYLGISLLPLSEPWPEVPAHVTFHSRVIDSTTLLQSTWPLGCVMGCKRPTVLSVSCPN